MKRSLHKQEKFIKIRYLRGRPERRERLQEKAVNKEEAVKQEYAGMLETKY